MEHPEPPDGQSSHQRGEAVPDPQAGGLSEPTAGAGPPGPSAPAGPVGAPAVVAVVVTRDPGPWLEETLAGIAASDYPELTVLVVDAGSGTDPTPRIAAVLPGAYVRRLPAGTGFAEAANESIATVEGGAFFVICHDDVVVEPASVRVLVEEAYRSNAAIVGPKVVDAEHPEVLLEVGFAIDRLGVPHSGIEPGELDQEQHDSVRDVFFVSSTAMLVRADLFAELGGFDPQTCPGGEDLDLCWRARIAGARVLVAPDARVRHHRRGRLRDGPTDAAALGRHRVRALLTSYSAWSLAVVVPFALGLALAEVAAFVVTRQRGRARAVIGSWASPLRDLRAVRAARRAAQARRHVPDSDLRPLQVRGSARVRGYVTTQLHAEDRLRELSDRGRVIADRAGSRARDPAWMSVAVFVALVLLGSRALVFGRIPDVGTLRAWPSVSGAGAAFLSAWREVGLGSPAPAPPLFALMSLLGAVLVGATALARTALVVGALPIGTLGAWRLGREVAGRGRPAIATGLAYGINPVTRNAIANGRFGPLVLAMLAPFAVHSLLAAAGLLGVPRKSGTRAVVLLGLLVAITTAAWPPALLLPLLVGMALLLAAPFVGDARAAGRALGVAVAATGVTLVVLLPWPLGYLTGSGRLAALGARLTPGLDLGRTLRFATGPAGGGIPGWALPVAALVALALASGPRLVWATRAAFLALAAYALAWAPTRLSSTVAVPAPEGVLVPAALGLALALGLGVAAFREDVRRVRFGWRQVAVAGGALALVLPVVAFAVASIDGRWDLPSRDWSQAVSWMRAQRADGSFRVLWVGDPDVLPLEPLRRGDLGYGTTLDGPGDARVLDAPPGGAGDRVLARAVDLLREARTERVGRILGSLAVRYVALPLRNGPGGARGRVPAGLRDALDDQLDLVRLESVPDLAVYENRAWIPRTATFTRRSLPRGDPITASLALDPEAARPLRAGRATSQGSLLLADTYARRWRASAGGRSLPHRRALGWASAWPVPARARVTVAYGGQPRRYLAALLEVVLLALALAGRGPRPRRARRSPRTRRRPAAAAERPTGTGAELGAGAGSEPGVSAR